MSTAILDKPRGRRPATEFVPLTPPPLQSGDHLTLAEFERRYNAMPEVKKAELIEGVVFMASPVSSYHADAHAAMVAWLKLYSAATPGTRTGDNVTVRLDAKNEVQPDVYLGVKEKHGGEIRLSREAYLDGAPELVVEIAVTSADMDLHEKFELYRRHRVREYLVWQVLDSHFHWFTLQGSRYTELRPSPDGIIRSRFFGGLWLDVPALLADEFGKVQKCLSVGLASSEHAEFAAKLAAKK